MLPVGRSLAATRPALSNTGPSRNNCMYKIENMKIPVTVILAVKNEGPNLRQCLRALAPAEKIYLVDSQSSDETTAIAAEYGVEVIQFHYNGGYPKKRQWAADQLQITTDWIFFIDGDEVV